MTADFSISVVIPTLNASGSLQVTVASLLARPEEILVIDGGSVDKTVEIASSAGARVIESERGRGLQLKTGGEAATSQWILFLHADTRLSSDWRESAYEFLSDKSNTARVAVFRLALDDIAPQARRIERLAAWRGRFLGLPYGDQGLLIQRQLYERVGGYRPLALMEDLDLVERLSQVATFRSVNCALLTSGERWQKRSVLVQAWRNARLRWLWRQGRSTEQLLRLYRR